MNEKVDSEFHFTTIMHFLAKFPMPPHSKVTSLKTCVPNVLIVDSNYTDFYLKFGQVRFEVLLIDKDKHLALKGIPKTLGKEQFDEEGQYVAPDGEEKGIPFKGKLMDCKSEIEI